MRCLENMDRLKIDPESVLKLLSLYEFRGKDYYYEFVLKQNINQITKQTIEKDTFYLGKILNLDITNNRQKLIIQKDSEPKTNDEKILRNIKTVLKIIKDEGDDFNMSTNEILHLGIRLFDGVSKVQYNTAIINTQENLLTVKKTVSKRKDIEDLIRTYNSLSGSKKYEITNIVTNFFVDFINLNLFNIGNDIIALLTAYTLLYKEKFKMLNCVSFFEILHDNLEEYNQAKMKANFNWKEGFSETKDLNHLLIQMLLIGYSKIDRLASDTKFDANLSKSYNIENTIQRLGEVFTKEEIRQRHPYVSLSTIDRTLKRLKDENKIRPNGVGRSASWIKLVEYERFEPTPSRQLSLYDIMMADDQDEK